MSTNIQKPVSVPVVDLIKQFGSYFAMNSRGYDGESCKTSESLGQWFNHQEEPAFSDCLFELDKFPNHDCLKLTLSHYYKEQAVKYNKKLDAMTFNVPNLIKLTLSKFGYFKEFRNQYYKVKLAIEKYNDLSKEPFSDSPTKFLTGDVVMPQYLLEDDKYYYYPCYYNTKIIIRRMQVVKQRICKVTNYCPNYEYAINYGLIDVDSKSFCMNYEHVKLTHFDGVKWSSHFDDDLLFVNEEDAKNYVKGQCQKSMSEISD